MTSQKARTLNDAITRVKGLLSQSESNWVEAFIILRKVENESTWMMAKGGCQSFQEFLKVNFPDSIPYTFYRRGIAAIELYGADFIKKVGVRSAHALMQDEIATNNGRRETLTRKLEAYVRKHGTAPRISTVWEIVRDIAPETAKRKPARRKIADLIKENAELRAENSRLTAENETLREENKQLRLKLRPARTRRNGVPEARV